MTKSLNQIPLMRLLDFKLSTACEKGE